MLRPGLFYCSSIDYVTVMAQLLRMVSNESGMQEIGFSIRSYSNKTIHFAVCCSRIILRETIKLPNILCTILDIIFDIATNFLKN